MSRKTTTTTAAAANIYSEAAAAARYPLRRLMYRRSASGWSRVSRARSSRRSSLNWIDNEQMKISVVFRRPTWQEERAVASGEPVHAERTETLSAAAQLIVDRVNFWHMQTLNERMNDERMNEQTNE